MSHWDLQVEACERRGEASRCIAVDKDHVGPLVLEDRLELQQYVARHVKQRLARLHNRQVVVGRHAEDAQHLVEHLAVLASHGHDSLELSFSCFQLINKRTHLNGLWTRPKDEHYLFHQDYFLPSKLFNLWIFSKPIAAFTFSRNLRPAGSQEPSK